MHVALATAPYHPELAKATVKFWLMVQKQNGGVIPREVRKENLISLWFDKTIRDGAEPRANLTYTNPYLMNWVMDALYRFDPSAENLALMKEVSLSIDSYTKWMEANRSVRDRDGLIIGFNGSALGTGADNSRGEIGNKGEDEAYQTGFVDFLAQQIAMLKDKSKWDQIFADESSNLDEEKSYRESARAALAKAQY
ncbi:MAG TPA: hypothetical protein VM432_08205, partial [Bdellovibrionales bacterium]|nr:hypothetical protein [Bdellovibrionales bacterium]